MSLSKTEQLLVEAVKSMLTSGDRLGLKTHAPAHTETGKLERGLEHLHGQIDEMFALKAAPLTHHTGICAAFSQIHSYKYIDDPLFTQALKRAMSAQGIPKEEAEKAAAFVPEIISELAAENAGWSEADHGFHPDLDDIMRIPGGD